MWITRFVELPDELIQAQKKNELVIFAGAGISISPPSNLPSFKDLTEKVNAGSLVQRKGESIDCFLGRLANEVQVHKRTHQILSNEESKPNTLHYSLVSLFPNIESLKIITTNQDRHLSTVVNEVFNEEVCTYYAPALPLGRAFKGIVYLHGSIDKDYHDFVLTDVDFGQAYLTDGWATRFLQDVFTNYTVLFIGYSHDDPIMKYLSRGLVKQQPRYAFSTKKQLEHWDFLQISTVCYPLSDGQNRHKHLRDAIDLWAKESQKDFFDHEHRIKEIAKSNPPIDRIRTSYIEISLNDIEKVRVFVKFANKPEWILWLDNRKHLDHIFDEFNRFDQITYELANWLIQNYIKHFSDELIALIRRHGQIANNQFWLMIAQRLANRKDQLSKEIRSKWISLILSSSRFINDYNLMSIILDSCQFPQDCELAILLFDYLIDPRIKLDIPFFENVISAHIDYSADDHYFPKSWDNFFKPNFDYFATRLVPILSNHIFKANILLKSIGHKEMWNTLGFSRIAIESNEQNKYRKELSILINTSRDVIQWLGKYKTSIALTILHEWGNSEISLLRRLAIYGLGESILDPNDKMQFILDKDNWLFSLDLQHEIYMFLKLVYPVCTDEARCTLIERVLEGPQGFIKEKLNHRSEELIYNLLYWLHTVAPSCQQATTHFNNFQSDHLDLLPPEHPEFNRYIGFTRKLPTPFSTEELLDKDPSKEWNMLVTYRGTMPFHDRFGLLTEISKSASVCFNWGFQLAKSLSENEVWDTDIWVELLSVWSRVIIPDWNSLLEFLLSNPELYINYSLSIIRILNSGLENENNALPQSCYKIAYQLSETIYELCVKQHSKPFENDENQFIWFEEALNHVGGQLSLFWILLLSKSIEKYEIPSFYKSIFEKVTKGESAYDQMGRVILTSQVLYLYSLDPKWTKENILRLFDWTGRKLISIQAWHGFLSRGSWNEVFLPELLPLLKKTFPKINSLSQVNEDFVALLANIAIFSSVNPISDGWLKSFIINANPQTKSRWAFYVRENLETLNKDQIVVLWNTWINEYWAERITGVPRSFSIDEVPEMISWLISLEPVFETAVNYVTQLPHTELRNLFIFSQLAEGDFSEKHPIALAKLLDWLLSNTSEQFWYMDEVGSMVEKLINTPKSDDILRSICQHLARLNYSKATYLKNLL